VPYRHRRVIVGAGGCGSNLPTVGTQRQAFDPAGWFPERRKLMPARGVPYANLNDLFTRIATGHLDSRGDALAVRAECHTDGVALCWGCRGVSIRPSQLGSSRPAPGIEQPRRGPRARRGEHIALGIEGQAPDRPGSLSDGLRLLVGCDIPDGDGI